MRSPWHSPKHKNPSTHIRYLQGKKQQKDMASALSCGCDPAPTDYYDDYTKFTTDPLEDDATETSSSESSRSVVLNVPYHKVTPLFRNIEKENWEGILQFLKTGKWNNGMFSNGNEHLRNPAAPLQCKTWVTNYDRHGTPEWSQLPLHAAISYSAPFVVIQKLIEMYPKAVQCTDNEGMLPVHLAFGFGAPENVLALLLEPFPSSVNERGMGGRYPYECCELGPNKIRGQVLTIVTDQVLERAKVDLDKDWREFTVAAQESIVMPTKQDVSTVTLHEFLLDLLKDRKQLQDMKRNMAAANKNALVKAREAASTMSRGATTASSSHNSGALSTQSSGMHAPTIKTEYGTIAKRQRPATTTAGQVYRGAKYNKAPSSTKTRRGLGGFFGRKNHV